MSEILWVLYVPLGLVATLYVHNYIYISNCIPKNMPADLKTLIRVSGDFFFALRERMGGGGGGIFNGRRL